jgi:hypothetical protein
MFMPRGAEISSLRTRGQPSICYGEICHALSTGRLTDGRVSVKNDIAKRGFIVSCEIIG